MSNWLDQAESRAVIIDDQSSLQETPAASGHLQHGRADDQVFQTGNLLRPNARASELIALHCLDDYSAVFVTVNIE